MSEEELQTTPIANYIPTRYSNKGPHPTLAYLASDWVEVKGPSNVIIGGSSQSFQQPENIQPVSRISNKSSDNSSSQPPKEENSSVTVKGHTELLSSPVEGDIARPDYPNDTSSSQPPPGLPTETGQNWYQAASGKIYRYKWVFSNINEPTDNIIKCIVALVVKHFVTNIYISIKEIYIYS